MRFARIAALAALIAILPATVHAEFPGRQANDYQNEEDGHPLKILSYLVAPIGFVLEWTVARPLHYLATDTAMAPVLGGEEDDTPNTPPAPIAEIPPPAYNESESRTPREVEIPAPGSTSPKSPAAGTTRPSSQSAPESNQPRSAQPGNQPVLH